VMCPRPPNSRCVRWPAATRGTLGRDRRARGTPRSVGGTSRPGVDLLAWHRYRQRRDALDRGLKDDPQRLRSEASFAILCAGSLPSKLPPARWLGIASTVAAIGRPSLGAVHDLPGQDAPGSAHQGVRHEAHTGGQEQARDHPLPKERYVAREVYRVLISCDALSSPTSPKEEAQIGAGNNAA
jgi:hypothetical protein